MMNLLKRNTGAAPFSHTWTRRAALIWRRPGNDAVRGLGYAGLGGDNAERVTLGLQKPGIFDLVRRMGERPADPAAARFGDGTGVGRALSGEGAFHLREQGQQQEGDSPHSLIRGVDGQRVGQRPYSDALLGQLMDEVENLAEVAADPVEGVHDHGVAVHGQGIPRCSTWPPQGAPPPNYKPNPATPTWPASVYTYGSAKRPPHASPPKQKPTYQASAVPATSPVTPVNDQGERPLNERPDA
jgi:hypothetical protein